MQTIHEHARRIHELVARIDEIGYSEGRRNVEDYSAEELVTEARDILCIMEEWDSDAHYDQQEKRRQVRLLKNFVKKWGTKE